MKIKYLILDMGRVLIEPTTGHWQITPAVVNTISDKDFDYMKLASAMKENGNILDKKCCTLEEEREIVYEYYKKSFEDIEYDITEDKLNKIVKRVKENYHAEFRYTQELRDEIISRCNNVASGARLIDAIVNNDLLPELSARFLECTMEEKQLVSATASAKDGKFVFDFETKEV